MQEPQQQQQDQSYLLTVPQQERKTLQQGSHEVTAGNNSSSRASSSSREKNVGNVHNSRSAGAPRKNNSNINNVNQVSSLSPQDVSNNRNSNNHNNNQNKSPTANTTTTTTRMSLTRAALSSRIYATGASTMELRKQRQRRTKDLLLYKLKHSKKLRSELIHQLRTSSLRCLKSTGQKTSQEILFQIQKLSSSAAAAASSSSSSKSFSLPNKLSSFQTKKRKWDDDYDPEPLVDQSTILLVAVFLFVLAVIWPPLILLVAYTASKLIPYSFRVNDSAVTRRKLWKDFCHTATNLPENFMLLMKNEHPTIQLKQGYWENSRGMLLSTSTLTPKTKPMKAVVCYCHGYSDSTSFVKLIENQRLTEEGIAFCAIEYEGHGQSDGALGLIPDWEALIDDVSTYFAQLVSTTPQFQKLPVFLMGESMGGAIAYSVYQRIPHVFRGVVFCCPMCKIADDMLPPQWVIDLLMKIIGPSGTTSLLAYLPIAPSKGKELELYSQKLPEKRALAGRLPLNYCRHPRLATARELIQVTQRISKRLKDFDAPFLVLHGKADRVTDPRLSQALYDDSISTDKTIQLYDDMWHAFLSAEPDENIDKVYADIVEWILQRSSLVDTESK